MISKVREERSQEDYRRRWYQEGIDLKGARAPLGAAEVMLEEEAEERDIDGNYPLSITTKLW